MSGRATADPCRAMPVGRKAVRKFAENTNIQLNQFINQKSSEMKRIFLLLAACAAIFASCSKNEGADASNGDDMYVSFHVKAPASGVVTYAVSDAVPAESKVNVLYVYVFGPNANASATEVGTTDEYVLEGLYTYKQPAADATDYIIDNIKVTGKNVKHIYFVANRRIVAGSVGTVKETAIVNAGCGAVAPQSAQPFISLTGHGEYPWIGLPMSAYTEVDFSSGTAAPATHPGVALLRAVARVDVLNATKNYNIESIAMRSRSNGYMFPSAFDGTGAYVGLLYTGMDAFVMPNTSRADNFGYAATKELYGDIDFATVHGGVLAPSADPDPVANPSSQLGAGYLYEAGAADGASLVVKCRNTVSGELRVLEIPFEQGLPLAPIAVQRNYVYTFKIFDTTYEGLEASFNVADWEDSPAVLEIEIPMNVAFTMAIPAATPLAGGETFAVNSNGGYDLNNIPLAGGSYIINIDSQNVAIAVDQDELDMYPWIQNFAITPNADGLTNDITFDVAARAAGFTYNRGGAILIKGNLVTSPAITIGLSQKFN